MAVKVPKVTCYAEAKVDTVKVPKVPKVGMTDAYGANETPSPMQKNIAHRVLQLLRARGSQQHADVGKIHAVAAIEVGCGLQLVHWLRLSGAQGRKGMEAAR